MPAPIDRESESQKSTRSLSAGAGGTRGATLNSREVVQLLNICLSHKDTYGRDNGSGWIQKWWNTIAAELKHSRKKPYSQKACRDNVGKQVALREAEKRNLRTGEEASYGEWGIAVDAWIEVIEQYRQEQQAAKDRSAEDKAQRDQLRMVRDNMKRRLGQKEGPEESSSSDCGSCDEERVGGSTRDPANASTTTGGDALDVESQLDSQVVEESDRHRNPRRKSQITTERSSSSQSKSRPAKKARPGDKLERAMIENSKEVAESYKQLVTAIVTQSDGDADRTKEAAKELEVIGQRQQSQEQKLDQQAQKLDQQGQKLDQLISLIQGLEKSKQ